MALSRMDTRFMVLGRWWSLSCGLLRGRATPIAAAVGLALVVVPGGRPAMAQGDSDPAVPVPSIDITIDVRATVPDEIENTPGAASVLTAEEFRELRPYTLHDALDFVPGVRTIDDDPLGRRSGIGVGGAPSRRSRKTLLLEDGTPINASTYLDPSGHYTPPMERIERIDVLRGSGQIVHGPLNNHGVINFRNARPAPVHETVAEIAGGSLGGFKRHLMHRRTDGRVGSVFAYTGADSDGAFDVEKFKYDDFFTSVDWRIASRQRVAASFTYFRERSNYDEANLSPEQFSAHPRSKDTLGEAREFNNISVNYTKLDLTHDFEATGRLSFSSKVFVTNLDRPRFMTLGTSPLEGGVMEGRDRNYRGYGVETRAEVANAPAWGLLHTLQMGGRWEHQIFDDKRPVGRPGDILNAGNRGNVFAVAGEDGFTRTGRLTAFRADAVSAFFQDTMRIGRWAITPGIRVERFTQRMEELFRPGSDLADESSDSTVVLPGINVLYSGPGEDTQIYAGVHRGYAPAIARTVAFPLSPETGVHYRAGLRSGVFPGISADFSVFMNEVNDTLIKEDFTDSFGDNIFINSANSREFGLDGALNAESREYLDSPFNLFARIVYGYTRSRFTEGALDGKRVPEVPLHAGSLTFGVEHEAGWDVSVTGSHFGHFFADRENTIAIDENRGRVPGRTLFSARASYTFSGTPLTLWIQGRNLTDKLYVSDVSDGLRPGAARSVMAGVTTRF